MTGPGPHVEDLAQEAFLRLYRALPEFRGDATISTYLYRIVVNLSQDEWKRRRRELSVLAAQPVFADEDAATDWLENFAGDDLSSHHARTPEQLMDDADTQRAVDEELLALPEIERSVLVLYHQEECSYQSISVALDLPINTVRTHLHRGRKRLGDRIRARLATQAHPAPQATASKTIAAEQTTVAAQQRTVAAQQTKTLQATTPQSAPQPIPSEPVALSAGVRA